MPPSFRRARFGPLEAAILSSLALAGGLLWRSFHDARGIIRREERALRAARALWDAEKAFRASGKLDADGDGTAEFGALKDLASAGLLGGTPVTDAQGDYLALEGYRLEVLLPERVDAGGRRVYARPPEKPDPRLCALAFAVIARPVVDGPRTLRAFYLDADGRAFAAEGVSDPDRDPIPPLPRQEFKDTKQEATEDGPVWRVIRFPGAR